MILLIDNYDSFSYNLYQMLGEIAVNDKEELKVIRNDAMTVEEIRGLMPDGIVLSPGPGRPEDAGVCIEAVRKLGDTIPVLGVCLGHQSICCAYGATVSYAKELMHGKQSEAEVDTQDVMFRGLAPRILVGRYHSLAAVEETLPSCLEVTARTDDGEVMSLRHSRYPVYGLQFHPESILTPDGKKMLDNWYRSIRKTGRS